MQGEVMEENSFSVFWCLTVTLWLLLVLQHLFGWCHDIKCYLCYDVFFFFRLLWRQLITDLWLIHLPCSWKLVL